jgi:hypothetical protein
MEYTLSDLDWQRFRHKTAKAILRSADAVKPLLAQTASDGVELLIVRVPTDQLDAVQALEATGAFLTDTLVYFRKSKLESYFGVVPIGYSTRIATAGDTAEVKRVAREIFRDYLGHYHADPRLAKSDADEVYASWAARSCVDEVVADAVVLIEKEDAIIALATVKMTGLREHEGLLFGVSPLHRCKGLHASLIKLTEAWGAANKSEQMTYSTQVTNIAAQKVLSRHGFEPMGSYYTLHRWSRKDE